MTGPRCDSGTVRLAHIWSPPTKHSCVPGGHGNSPLFLRRQIFVKLVPGAICVPSKIETSLTKRAANLQPPSLQPPPPRWPPPPPPPKPHGRPHILRGGTRSNF